MNRRFGNQTSGRYDLFIQIVDDDLKRDLKDHSKQGREGAKNPCLRLSFLCKLMPSPFNS